MASTTQKAACNRQPFVSEDGCDRGSVDIHQFDDFPFCDSASPTPPKVPPEVIDTPIVLPIPSPCACFNINHSFKFEYSKQRKFKARASFAARGDCCEGEYDAGFDLQIPCPVVGKAVRKIRLKVDYGDSGKSDSESYIEADKDSCTIEPKDVSLNVNLPCPLPKDADKGVLKFKIGYGDEGSKDSQSFAKTDRDSCTISPKDMNFDLKIPCPIRESATKKLKIGISYGSQQEASASFVKTSKDSCEIEMKDMDMTLQLPCPIRNPRGRKIKVAISYGNDFKSASESFIRADSNSCTIEALAPTLNLNIPCPIKKNDKKVTIGIDWGRGDKKKTKKIIEADSANCKIEALEESFALQIPCPVQTNGDKKITAKIAWKDAKAPAPQTFVKANKADCTIEPNDVTLDLGLPCPVKRSGDAKIKAKVKWGSQANSVEETIIRADNTQCTFEPVDASLNLTIPCPIKKGGKLKFRVRLGRSYASASASILEIDEASCSLRVKSETISLDLPCPITDTSKPKIRARVTYGNSTGQKSAEFLEQDKDKCTIKGKDATLDLQIKCPVVGNGGDKKIKASIKYGSGGASASATYLKTNTETCTVEGQDDVRLDLQIPCPVGGVNTNSKLTIKAKMGNQSTQASGSILTIDKAACSIGVNPATLNLNIPCPITNTSKPKIRARVTYGNSTGQKSAEFLEQDKDKCTIKGKDATLDLQIPCPVSKSRLVIDTSYETIESGAGGFSVDEDSFGEDCSRRIKLKVRVPSAGKVDATVLGAIQYKDHKLQVKTVNLKTGDVSGWLDVFEAVAHTGSC